MSETAGSGSGRYFVTVIATGREALLALRQLDLDLFKPTARRQAPARAGPPGPPGPAEGTADEEYRIDGLLTLEEIGRLASAGYRVLVQEDAALKARGQVAPRRAPRGRRGAEPSGPVGFEEWLKGMADATAGAAPAAGRAGPSGDHSRGHPAAGPAETSHGGEKEQREPMPPAGYLTAAGLKFGLLYLSTTYPALCQLIVLPETTDGGRTSRALRIGAGGPGERRASC